MQVGSNLCRAPSPADVAPALGERLAAVTVGGRVVAATTDGSLAHPILQITTLDVVPARNSSARYL